MSIMQRLVVNERVQTLPPLKWLLEGPAKTGKSTHAATWPDPIFLDMPDERGLAFIEGAHRIPIEKTCDLREVFAALKGPAKGKYKSVVIDTVGALFSLYTSETLKENNRNRLRIQDYPVIYDQMLRMLDGFNALGLHVVLVSHVKPLFSKEKRKRDEEPVVLKYINALPGKLSEDVASRADHILHTKVDDDGKYWVLCTNRALYEAGGRVKGLPSGIEIPEGAGLYPSILEAFENSQAAKSDPKKSKGKKDAPAADYSDPSKPTPEELEEWSDAAA